MHNTALAHDRSNFFMRFQKKLRIIGQIFAENARDQLLVEGGSKIFKLSIAITISIKNVAPLCAVWHKSF